jgi:hypothetical protein
MAGELAAHSSSRNGASVLWITIHTAEGPTDEFPSRPDLDAGSAQDLLAFFEPKTDRSTHAIADDDVLLDDLVPYDRAAWTLRNGNPHSDNLEMCGLASWSREEWLTHLPMLKNAARWVASRYRARGWAETPRRLSIADVQGRAARGYMDHNTYTKATGDGTHWDVGPNFPWDVFGPLVIAAFTGKAQTEEDDVTAADVWTAPIKNPASGAVQSAATRLLDIETRVAAIQKAVGDATSLLMYGDSADDSKDKGTHPNNAQEIRRLLLQLTADSAAREAALLEAIKAAATGGPIDLSAVQTAAERGAADALARVQLVVDPPVAPPTDPAPVA